MELDQIKKIVACVITSQGRTGTAFLISQTHALTCAHCVATVENRNVSHVRKRVKLEFTEWQIANKTRHASVAEVDGRRDVALLTLDQPIDKELIPIALNGIIEEEWKTFAYPDSLEKDGMPFDGEVTDLDATFYGNRGYLLLRCRQGRDAVAGASGGPIVVSDAIIGILSNQPLDEHKNPLFHTIYGVPVKKIEDLVKTAGVKLTPRQRTLKGQVFLVGQDEEILGSFASACMGFVAPLRLRSNPFKRHRCSPQCSCENNSTARYTSSEWRSATARSRNSECRTAIGSSLINVGVRVHRENQDIDSVAIIEECPKMQSVRKSTEETK